MSTSADSAALQPVTAAAEYLFPTLTADQIARVASLGRRRPMRKGDVIVEVGDSPVPVFVVVSGELQALRPWSGTSEQLIVTHHAGQFSGEATTIAGRRAIVRLRVGQDGELIELGRDPLLRLVQTDADLSEIIMRALLLRRVELVARGLGDVVVIGSLHCAGTLRVKEFLTRNGHPHAFIDLDSDPDSQALLDRFHVTPADVPVLICRGSTVLRNPNLSSTVGSEAWNSRDLKSRPH